MTISKQEQIALARRAAKFGEDVLLTMIRTQPAEVLKTPDVACRAAFTIALAYLAFTEVAIASAQDHEEPEATEETDDSSN